MTDARQIAADYISAVVNQAYEDLTLEEIETSFQVDTEDAMNILFAVGSMNLIADWDDQACACVHEDEVVLGDPDPTTVYGDDYECCPEREGPWSCTRMAGHSGQHVAGDGYEVCAVWL
jgi:hypothetical protein